MMMPSIQTSSHMSDLTTQPSAVAPVDNKLQEKSVSLNAIRLDGGTQSRVAIDELVVEDYAEAMLNGAKLPPATVFFDGTNYWLADGFHRFHAHRKIGALNIDTDLREGTLKDAMLFSYGANQNHGLRRSTADKRKAVLGMLADFGDWSDSKIGRYVGVDHKTVAAHRSAILGSSQDEGRTRMVERNGKAYPQQTGKIGKAVRSASPYTPSTNASPATEVQPSEENPAPPQESVASVETDALLRTPEDLAACRKELGAAQALITTLQIENAKLMQEVAILNARLKAAASGQGDDSGGAAAAHTASEE